MKWTAAPPITSQREDIIIVTRLWNEMKGLVKEGLAQHLGVSNFPVAALRLLDKIESQDIPNGLRPDICQVEHHPYYRNEDLIDYCQSRPGGAIQVVAHTPLGRPGKMPWLWLLVTNKAFIPIYVAMQPYIHI